MTEQQEEEGGGSRRKRQLEEKKPVCCTRAPAPASLRRENPLSLCAPHDTYTSPDVLSLKIETHHAVPAQPQMQPSIRF